MIEAQHRLLYIARLVCHTQSICLWWKTSSKKKRKRSWVLFQMRRRHRNGTGWFGQRRRRSGSRFQCHPFKHLSYILIYQYALSCFLNSFVSQPLRSPSSPPLFTKYPSILRRHVIVGDSPKVFIFPHLRKIQNEFCRVYGVKNFYSVPFASF